MKRASTTVLWFLATAVVLVGVPLVSLWFLRSAWAQADAGTAFLVAMGVCIVGMGPLLGVAQGAVVGRALGSPRWTWFAVTTAVWVFAAGLPNFVCLMAPASFFDKPLRSAWPMFPFFAWCVTSVVQGTALGRVMRARGASHGSVWLYVGAPWLLWCLALATCTQLPDHSQFPLGMAIGACMLLGIAAQSLAFSRIAEGR